LNKKLVGVLGAGSFGSTVARLLASNTEVLIYTRKPDKVKEINEQHSNLGFSLPENITATSSLEELADRCQVIFPILPSSVFRETLNDISQFLHPYHILIHGTKGFDLVKVDLDRPFVKISRSNLRTMSEVIAEETQVKRIGCLSGPNLSRELQQGFPASSVVASEFDEVIQIGHDLLNSLQFKIYGSHDILGTELAGALKNMIAVGTGIIGGLGLGKNVEAFFITRGLRELILIGTAMGAQEKTFFGTAGIGDLIATATSKDSRNYSFGYRLAKGFTKSQIESEIDELAEGVRTIELIHHFTQAHQIDVPIVESLYALIYRDFPLEDAITYLLNYPFSVDVDFL
jgi:glycerol-3-phosphate dehydrogenase (NAD(P)+)